LGGQRPVDLRPQGALAFAKLCGLLVNGTLTTQWGLGVAHDSDHAESGTDSQHWNAALRGFLAIPARAGFRGKPGMTLVWGGVFLSGGRQTEDGGFSHRSPPGDRPPKRRCPVLSSTGNTPGDSPFAASGGHVYGLFTGYRG